MNNNSVTNIELKTEVPTPEKPKKVILIVIRVTIHDSTIHDSNKSNLLLSSPLH